MPAVDTGGDFPIYRFGKGPQPVILLHELPGLTPGALDLARDLSGRGCTVYVPLLFGKPGQHSGVKGLLQVCASPDWDLRSAEDAGKIREKLIRLTNRVTSGHKGRKAIIIGNCLTGSIPLELAVKCESIGAVVLCQPALPLKKLLGKSNPAAFGLPPEILNQLAARIKRDPALKVISVNFLEDDFAPVLRTAMIQHRISAAGARGRGQHVIIGGGDLTKPLPGCLQGLPGLQRIPLKDKDGEIVEKGHPTITGAEEAAHRAAFRCALYKLLPGVRQQACP